MPTAPPLELCVLDNSNGGSITSQNLGEFEVPHIGDPGERASQERNGSYTTAGGWRSDLTSKPPVANIFTQGNGRYTPSSNLSTYGRDTPVNTVAVSTLTERTELDRQNGKYVEMVRYQRVLSERDVKYRVLTNAKNTFNKALWKNFWADTKLLLIPTHAFKNPDFVGEMFDRASNTSNSAVLMCEACLDFIEPENPIGRNSESLEKLVTFWQTYNSVVKNVFVDMRNSVVDGIKSRFIGGKT